VTKTISATDLKHALDSQDELALFDLREQGVFTQGHLLFAMCLSLSRLELAITDLVPRKTTPIVVCDGGAEEQWDLAARGAARLAELGYGDVAILEGGVPGWAAAGYEVFSGVNVPSKAFGEFVEHRYDTPHLSAEALKAEMDAGRDMVILDSRPIEEYHRMSIPGGVDMPGAELVYRVHELAPDPDTLVVVNCAGRTRSIIGAQSLINAGIPNQVMALKDGTMGWHLAGLTLDHGQDRRWPGVSKGGLAAAKAAADRVRARFGVKAIDRDELADWQAATDTQTLYVLDVRQPEEFENGHLPGSRNAPGGQLVQATDEYVGTRNARIVLVDDTEVRAVMTASWLVQMGWTEVRVLAGGLGSAGLETGPRSVALPTMEAAPRMDVATLNAALEQGNGVVVVDLATSLQYRDGHIPRAWWAIRARFSSALFRLPPVDRVVLTSPDGRLAELAFADAKAARPELEISILDGGTAAWKAAGLALEEGANYMTCDTDDVWYKPYDREGGVERWMQDYLTWEVGLVDQINRDGGTDFRYFAAIGD